MIAVIKYNAGNVRSISNALQRLNIDARITDDPTEIRNADKVIFPGVGEASTAMKYLKERKLDEVLKDLTQPFLGICLGLQLMCEHTEEGEVDCIGIFPEKVKIFPPTSKVPHMGWNDFTDLNSPLFNNIDLKDDMYFVHSYYAEVGQDTIATTDYILPFSSAFQKDNFYAVQFHPEKSADVGQQLLRNFLEL